MKKILLLFSLALFSISPVFASESEKADPEQLFLNELDIKFLLDGKTLTCIRPYYRRNYPLIRMGSIREMDGLPAGPFGVQFKVSGSGKVRERLLQDEEGRFVADFEGAVEAIRANGDLLTEKQMEDLFLEIEDPWVYEKPVEGYFPADSGVLMNLKPGFNLSPEQEEAKLKKMETIKAKLDVMMAEQNLENKKAVELLDKKWYETSSGFGNKVEKGHRKMVLIISQQELNMAIEEVLFVIESPVTYYEETVAWCAPGPVIDRALKIGKEIRDFKAGR